jgi:glyoxylase-like metal-dependent hydrolase (beta-lactamase superfamily II)
MAEIKVLIEGKHHKEAGEKLYIGSCVTLIKSDKNIIVDTGAFPDKDKIIFELKKENLSPDDIDIVILTHLHLDHIVNVSLFRKAKIFLKFRKNYPGQFHIPEEGCLQRADLFDGTELAKDVSILLTPGHSEDMISVLVKTPEGNIVIAGDAIPSEDYLDLNNVPAMLSNLQEFNESRKKIIKNADFIIPGHGRKFKVSKNR